MFDSSDPQVRCCPDGHGSYYELVAHLGREFGEVDTAEVAREVARAVAAADFAGLDRAGDRMLICELIARQQLQLLTGRRPDVARLDPQLHPARSGITDQPAGHLTLAIADRGDTVSVEGE